MLLVVLPAVVFGGLLWRQLERDQSRRLQALPAECADAATRLSIECAEEIGLLLDSEFARPFDQYAAVYFAEDMGPIRPLESPLEFSRRPDGVLGWFSFRSEGRGYPEVDVRRGSNDGLAEEADPIRGVIEELVQRELVGPILEEGRLASDELRDAEDLEGYGERRPRLIRTVVLSVAEGQEAECEDAVETTTALMERREHDVHVRYFSLRIVPRGEALRPSVIAYRYVVIPAFTDIPNLPACIDAISHDLMLVQGFLFDPDWLYGQMPRGAAERVLGRSQELVSLDSASKDRDVITAPFDPLSRLTAIVDRESPLPRERLGVELNAGQLRSDFRVQNAWFLGMAFVLTVSMSIGILLLLSSIRASRDEAERTRNFVASVTHELRTPIAAVKLYGEMLSDGWVTDEARKSEYLTRIVHESDRLGGLVDRVLLRRRLYDADQASTPGDLNSVLRELQPGLEMVAGRTTGDIEFELEDGLPDVMLMPEGVHVVVQNLVENARKYAPVEMGASGPAGEPILVRTRLSQKGNVMLEVLDRGPGIAERDRNRVFEAFLRLGDERTRRTTGTGLGLHLVALQARAMGGRVRALPRAGGGTVMQVKLKRARRRTT